jgi:hypothetical protein
LQALIAPRRERFSPAGRRGHRESARRRAAPQPALAQESLAQLALARPALPQSALAQPALAQLALAQPKLARSALPRPAPAQQPLSRSALPQPVLARPASARQISARSALLRRVPAGALLLLLAVAALVSGCSAQPTGSNTSLSQFEDTFSNAAMSPQADGGAGIAMEMAEAGFSDGEATAASLESPPAAGEAALRKEIKNGYAQLDAKDAAEAYATAMGTATALGGYEFGRSESRSGGNVHISLTLKLPPESLAEFEARLRAAVSGSITIWNISSEDITSQYYDAAARLESMERSLSQYLELIGEARNVSDILEIRREVTALQADIDSLRGMLRMWDALVAYATFRLEISQSAAPLESVGSTEWRFSSPGNILAAMQSGFVTTGNALYRILVWLAVALVSLLPVLVPAALVVAAVLRFRKKRRRVAAARPQDSVKTAADGRGAAVYGIAGADCGGADGAAAYGMMPSDASGGIKSAKAGEPQGAEPSDGGSGGRDSSGGDSGNGDSSGGKPNGGIPNGQNTSDGGSANGN